MHTYMYIYISLSLSLSLFLSVSLSPSLPISLGVPHRCRHSRQAARSEAPLLQRLHTTHMHQQHQHPLFLARSKILGARKIKEDTCNSNIYML